MHFAYFQKSLLPCLIRMFIMVIEHISNISYLIGYRMNKKDEKKDKQDTVSTDELLRLLKDTQSIESFYKQTGESLSNISTSEYLAQLLAQHKLLKQEVIEAANLERTYGYQIFSGQRNPKRDTTGILATIAVMATAFAILPKKRRDAAILYCIHNGLNLLDTDILLEGIGEPLLSK